MKFIKKFEDITIKDVPMVGGKNASLGEMIQKLSKKGLRIPTGFAITAKAYWHYIDSNNLREPIQDALSELKDYNNTKKLQVVGKKIRKMLVNAVMPKDLAKEIEAAYSTLCKKYKQQNCDVAVRSSATAEDLPNASFAGQQDTFLNVHGSKELIEACKKCIASLFTDRAIVYRMERGFDHFKVALSVGVQRMIRSDLASSGVSFSLDTETGFKDVVMIDSSYGLGESIVQGMVTPDEFLVYKPTLEQGFKPIIKKKLGDKKTKIVYNNHSNHSDKVKTVPVKPKDQLLFSLTNDEILELAHAVIIIEHHYTDVRKKWSPMDIEWAKDGKDGKLYIIQARPETIYSSKKYTNVLKRYSLKKIKEKPLVVGLSIGKKIAYGKVRVIKSAREIDRVKKGDVIVTSMTDPDWVPAMKRAAAIVTEQGGRTCHAAIVSRELGIPAIVGALDAMKKLKTGQEVTIDCSGSSDGSVYKGKIPFTIEEIKLTTIPKLPIDVMVNIAEPDSAFSICQSPVQGVGLARLEFIISNAIQVHPMALLHPDKITDKKIRHKIDELAAAYPSKKEFFIDSLAQGIGMIGAAFHPRPVIARLSDFKTNEYRNLIGGIYFEPEEANPMLGLRGASRYYNKLYKDAFELECAAFKKVREVMGLKNVQIMVPFVRTVHEALEVLKILKKHGLEQTKDLSIIMMCEVPSNVILIDDFLKHFAGISIGSNDLTQLTLGVDRDSEILAAAFNEKDPAVYKMFSLAIEGAKRNKKYSGICGQAPSDYPEVADFLIKQGIESISLNADSVIPFLMRYAKKERK